MSNKVRGKNSFNSALLDDDRFKAWLVAVPNRNDSARCKICNRNIKIDSGGVSCLISHTKSNKLIDLDKSSCLYSSLYFKKKEAPISSDSTTVTKSTAKDKASSNRNTTLENLRVPLSSTEAEIRWVLKVVTAQFTFHSCLDVKHLFISMFGEQQVLSKFSLSKAKYTYIINYGIAPYFKESLTHCIKESLSYSTLFDESLNSKMQEQQMDIQIRFWDTQNHCVKTQYYDSQFLYRPNADNLYQCINTGISQLPKQQMIQLSMDGPNKLESI